MNALIAAGMGLALALAGMTALSLAMDRHHAQFTGHRRPPAPGVRWGLRALGIGLLLAAGVAGMAGWGRSVGWVAWLGFATVGALLVTGLLPYAPRALVGLAVLATAGAAALWVLA